MNIEKFFKKQWKMIAVIVFVAVLFIIISGGYYGIDAFVVNILGANILILGAGYALIHTTKSKNKILAIFSVAIIFLVANLVFLMQHTWG